MFDAINPLYWWGAVAVGVPIIIHLINRLRYRRVRWAAMEFLLKSQQRNRRKLILQQLLLLLLRCALVMLIVALVVRPLWLLGTAGASSAELPTYHVVLLDDSLSMQDVENPQDKAGPTAFREGVRVVLELARKASESSSAQYFTVLKLSDPKNPELGRSYEQLAGLPPGQQMSDDELRSLRTKLESLECSYLRLQLVNSLEEAGKFFSNIKDGNKHLHIVSDFRRPDWTGGDTDALCQRLAELAHPRGGNVQVRLYDAAQPRRSNDPHEVPRGHVNVGITNLTAKTQSREQQAGATRTSGSDSDYPVRVVTPGIPIYLHVTVRNFSDTERTGLQLKVQIDGRERTDFSQDLKSLAAGEEKVVEIAVRFSSEDALGLKQVAVYFEDNERRDFLPADNIRYTFLDLRKEIPVLLVDPLPATDRGDSYYINLVLTANRSFGLKPQQVRPTELKNVKDLDRYSVIYLLNVPGVGPGASELDPEGLAALEGYVQRGGSVVFFLGPRVNVLSYNEHFYKNGAGLFPAPLLPRPDPSRPLQYMEEPPDLEDYYSKLRFLKPDHPAFDIFQRRSDFLHFMTINCYFRVDPAWQPTEQVQVIAQLQNRQPLANFRLRVSNLVQSLNADNTRFRQKLIVYAKQMSDWMSQAEQKRARKGPLIDALGGLLDDSELVEYWSDAGRQPLKGEVAQLRETLVKGDPFILEGAVAKGKGHVLAILTSAGPTPIQGKDYGWNNWANDLIDERGFPPFVPMILDLQQHMANLSRLASEMPTNWLLGETVEFRLNKDRYAPYLQLWHQKEGMAEALKATDLEAREEGGELVARVVGTRGPGFYVVRLNQPPPDNSYQPKGEPEDRPLAFNVDNRDEGLLSRISEAELRDQLAAALSRPAKEGQESRLRLTPQESQAFVRGRPWFVTNLLETLAEDVSRNKSWSDYAWMLLLFFVVLLTEQWLAMKMSHHLK